MKAWFTSENRTPLTQYGYVYMLKKLVFGAAYGAALAGWHFICMAHYSTRGAVVIETPQAPEDTRHQDTTDARGTPAMGAQPTLPSPHP